MRYNSSKTIMGREDCFQEGHVAGTRELKSQHLSRLQKVVALMDLHSQKFLEG